MVKQHETDGSVTFSRQKSKTRLLPELTDLRSVSILTLDSNMSLTHYFFCCSSSLLPSYEESNFEITSLFVFVAALFNLSLSVEPTSSTWPMGTLILCLWDKVLANSKIQNKPNYIVNLSHRGGWLLSQEWVWQCTPSIPARGR